MYAKYTGFFRTRRENHNLIKFSPFLGLGTPRDTVYSWGEGANEQKTNKRKKEFVWSKQDLRRNSRLFGVLTEPCSVTYDKVRAFARTRQEPRKSIKFSPFLGKLDFGFLGGGIPCEALYVIPRHCQQGTPRDTCTRGEKAHTSKRVSIIACNNVISKAQCATHHRERTP